MVPVISIVGRSKVGKTSLLERLVKEIKGHGYRTAVIKHSGTGYEFYNDKDTGRLWNAGSDVVVFSGPEEFVLQKHIQTECALPRILSMVCDDVDIVFTEGYKEENFPKVEVFTGQPCNLLTTDSERIAAVPGDSSDFGAEIEKLAALIIGSYLDRSGGS